jgi:hypothetical protein
MAEYVWEEADSTNPWGRKRARGTHCSKGHEFTEENTFIRPYDKTRVCRECRRQYARKKYKENKQAGKTKPRNEPVQTFELPESTRLDKKSQMLYNELLEELKTIVTPCMEAPTIFDEAEDLSDETSERLCYGCPLLKKCYDFAVESKQEYGIWGGINFTHERYRNGIEWFEGEDLSTWFIEQ